MGALVLVDILLRRLCLPLVLIAAVIFRYNVLSLMYLLLFITSLLLPGPHLKAKKASSLVYLSVVLVWSGLAVLGQALFQITLASNYSDLLQPCEQKENIWRQFGFILYRGTGIQAVDVVRHLLPDCVVFIMALASIITNGRVLSRLRQTSEVERESCLREESGGGDQDISGRNDELHEISSGSGANPHYPSHVQCYLRLPKTVSLLFDGCTFIMLGLAGVTVPSLTSFVYYVVFLIILSIWSCHRRIRWKAAVRVLRCGLTFYTMLHLVVLYLYQFQAAQQNIPLQPNDTAHSVLARLFGLTAVIRTDCEQPAHLLLHSDLEYPVFVNPVLLLLLCLLLTTDLRLWINTPDVLWRKHAVYSLPVSDSEPSSTIVRLVSSGRASSPDEWTHYGTYRIRGKDEQAAEVDGATGDNGGDVHYKEKSLEQGEGEDVEEAEAISRLTKRRVTWLDVKERVIHSITVMRMYLLSTSYVPAIICMMLWSVLYPSWPALVLLLWACAIWLIPKFTPKNSLFYTSPILVIYSLCLLMLQYVFSLDLTLDELSPLDGLGQECYNLDTQGCRSFVPLVKTAFTLVFFCAFHEFVRIMKDKRNTRITDDTADGEVPLIAMHTQEGANEASTVVQRMSSELVRSGYTLLSNYWVLVVVSAFLLLFLSGEPNMFKTIYLIFFFVFLVTYQVFRGCWYHICVPIWWGLVVYAALELVLIYTYQFDSISDAWKRAYNDTPHVSVDAEDLFHSIGLRKYGINSLRSLLVSLIPPAIFIAVMSMQLRYFNPKISSGIVSDASSLSMFSFHSSRTQTSTASRDSATVVDVPAESQEETTATPGPVSRASSVASSAAPGTPLYYFYRVISYLLLKTKQIVWQLIQLFWRFLELHLHKISMLVIFVVVVSEVSAGYWVLLIVALLAIPLPYISPILYPLLTSYVGILSVVKTVYQFPIIKPDMFNLTTYNSTDDNTQCYEPLNTTSYLGNYSGLVFNYRYSSRVGDGGWFGLHKVSNYAQYILGPLCIALLLSLRFSAKQHQSEFYHLKNIVIDPWEQGSLFLSVSRHKAETSILAAFKYLINHTFEMYGVEVTLIMIAITVAVRVDTYGIFYCVVLGLMIILPHWVLSFMWLLYTVIHGLLLMLQYSMLLGVPPGLCFYPDGNKKYPWGDISDHTATNFGLKKWFFLSDYLQMLDKSTLYVDFLVYMLLCMQLYNFRHLRQLSEPLSDYLKNESVINYVKIFVVKYYFWISIFLVFFAAISRVSFFGFLYLLLCFVLLYRGQNMLMDRQSRRIKSWGILRLLAWGILFVRVSVQIADCVFYDDLERKTRCNLILVFNGGCNRESFYGSPNPDCKAYPHNVGLWVDSLTFAVVTIQIIIYGTQYSEMMRDYLIDRSKKAGYFSDVFEKKMEKRQQKAKEMKQKEFMELKERAQRLSTTEVKIDHVLHAGVRIPPDISVQAEFEGLGTGDSREGEVVSHHVAISGASSPDVEEPKSKLTSKVVEEASKLSRLGKYVSNVIVEFMDKTIEWLEKSNSLYMEVVEELRQQEKSRVLHEDENALLEIDKEEPSYSRVQVELHPVESESIVETSDAECTALKTVETPPATLLPQSPIREADDSLQDTKKVRFTEQNHPTITNEDDGHLAEIEAEFSQVAEKFSKRPVRLLKALQNSLLAHAEYVIYFLVVLNVILNGSVLSLGYVCLLFAWGVLCIPWPSKTFWLSMIFYTMLVLVLKYGFQFYDINYDDEDLQSETGFSLPNILGIKYHQNSADFFENATWDMLLLIALLLNRGLLKQNGLWGEHTMIRSNVLDGVKKDVKQFYSRLLNPDISQGAADYYVIMLFFDVLCLVTIVFGVSSFGIGIAGGGLGQAAAYIQDNYVPLPFVVMLLLQFLSMLVDRAIYLRRALKAKFVFQMFLLVIWHLWLLFVLPSGSVTRTPFTENIAAQCIYFFKCLYFIVSAMQIICGYPTRVLGYFLGRQYTTVSGVLFSVYRAIPLLPELREVMDWVFTDTALPLFHWLRVQEIYTKLYMVKVRRHREKGSPRDLGEQQSVLIKALLGGLLLVCLVLLIWGPLLVISFINSTSISNHPVATTISLSLDGYEPLVQTTVQHESVLSITNPEYEYFRSSFESEVQLLFGNQIFQSDFTKVVFPNESTSLWTISPPARLLLLNSLEDVRKSNKSIAMMFSWKIQRQPVLGSAAEVVSGLTTRSLTYTENPSTIDNFIATLNGDKTVVSLMYLYPRVIYAPETGQSENYTDLSRYLKTTANIACSTSLSSSNTSDQVWWTLTKCTNPIFTNDDGPPILLIYSQRIAPQVFSLIAGFGIIGLYVSVVLVLGRLIRNAISSLPSQILLDEIVNPDQLLKLCNDIFTVRESGDFKLEEILVGKLFAIFRSPEKLIEITEEIKIKKD